MGSLTTTFETRWWRRDEAEADKVVCTLCPRECHIPAGSRGFCFVRANVDGELVLTTYGRSSGFCIDPIEKKPLNHFLPGTPILSLGTAGCNLGCKFCQNWDISRSREMDTLAGQAGPEAIVAAARQYGCRSIAFTYNDPVIWAEYAIDIAKIARAEGIRTVAVTAGYMNPEPRREFYRWMDAANVDLKAFTETFYRKLTQTQLQPVLDTLKYLKEETDVWFEITTLVIPGENDDRDETAAMCDWILRNLGPDVPLHFSAFHPDFKMRDKPATPAATLIEARQIALDRGLHYVYTGNVYDLLRQSTYCHHCGTCVIERDWYELGRWRLHGNRCANCGGVVPGVFDDAGGPGDWGRKRQPIHIHDPKQYIAISSSARDRRTVEDKTMTPDFTDEQCRQMLAYARHYVEAMVRRDTPPASLPRELAEAPAFGAFLTLRRGDRLRACRGKFGQNGAPGSATGDHLGTILASVARDSALLDARFPVIRAQELDKLDLDISVMHSPAMLEQTGPDLANAIEVGRDGLVLHHPRGRGLLLPHVATEHGWDAPTFLSQLCLKAGLPADTWRHDRQTRVMTFQTRLLIDPAPRQELDPARLSANLVHLLIELTVDVLEGEQGGDLGIDALDQPRPEELGVHLLAGGNLAATSLGAGMSLSGLVTMAARSLRELAAKKGVSKVDFRRLILLHQAIRLSAMDYPQRHATLAGSAVLLEKDGGWTLQWPTGPGAGQGGDPVSAALQAGGISPRTWKLAEEQAMPKPRLTAFSLFAHDRDHHPGAIRRREPARAGQFYPDDAAAMRAEVRQFLDAAGDAQPQRCRAIMLPHAGWRYCGATLAKTLGQVIVPDTVMILGPKHTPHGANWSVPPHQAWAIPGAEIPIDTTLVGQLLDTIPGLRCEPEAHRMEHGAEVLLPFLLERNPQLHVVPMTLGHSNYEQTQPIAAALAQVLTDRPDVLLVISSDMNHFAPAQRGQELDRMALDAMTSGEPDAPRRLYDVCQREQISMCGMRPAVAIMAALLLHRPDLKPQLIDYSHSGIITGDYSSVVGYAGVILP